MAQDKELKRQRENLFHAGDHYFGVLPGQASRPIKNQIINTRNIFAPEQSGF